MTDQEIIAGLTNALCERAEKADALRAEVARLTALLHPQPLPCGHPAEHGHTADNGVTIRCCACDVAQLTSELAEFKRYLRCAESESKEQVARLTAELAKARSALAKWMLGEGDTEMESECARLRTELDNGKAEWATAMRDIVAEREAHAQTRATLDSWVIWASSARCIYCEQEFEQDPLDPAAADEVKKAHILVCSKHPYAEAKARADRAEAVLRGLRAWLTDSIDAMRRKVSALQAKGCDCEAHELNQRITAVEAVLAKLNDMEVQ